MPDHDSRRFPGTRPALLGALAGYDASRLLADPSAGLLDQDGDASSMDDTAGKPGKGLLDRFPGGR